MASEILYERDRDSDRDIEIEALKHEVLTQRRELSKLYEHIDEETQRKIKRGTPNLDGEITIKLNDGEPTDEEFRQIPKDERTLHALLFNGPEALVDEQTPTYPVHERAHAILTHAPMLSRQQSNDGSTVFLTVPSVKRFLERKEGSHLKHTQIRRAFEALCDAGRAYPRPPTMHKNRDSVIELAIFDYPRLFDDDLF